MDKHMITLFYFHLVSDYLTSYKIYDVTDFGGIKRNTEPTEFWHHPSGTLITSTESKLESDSKIKIIKVNPVIPYPSGSAADIYIPKGASAPDSSIFSRAGINLIPKNIEDSPQVIKDLKSVINPKVIHNHHNLIVNIDKFNKALSLKLAKMNNNTI